MQINFIKPGLFLFLTFLLAANVFGQSVSKVGMTERNFVDEQRKNWTGSAERPVFTVIWYPTDSNLKEENVVIGAPDNPIFISGAAVRNAEISSAQKRYPLIIVSHGTGGSALQMMWLGQYLAARGFIVAAVNHHGNTGAEDKYLAQGFTLWWERAEDLRVAVDKLLADQVLGKHIDAKRIGAAGFSLGGSTVTSIAGGIFDLNAYDKFCASPERDATCEPQPEFPNAMKEFEELRKTDPIVIESLKRMGNSYRDPRIKAVLRSLRRSAHHLQRRVYRRSGFLFNSSSENPTRPRPPKPTRKRSPNSLKNPTSRSCPEKSRITLF
jgi:predicted dienelactone hydrolase